MSVSRTMKRKAARDKEKAGKVAQWQAEKLAEVTGAKIDTLRQWLEARSDEMQDEMAGNMARLLWEAEDYMATANMIIMLHAVLEVFGDLKTIDRRMGQLVEAINPSIEHVDKTGIREAYEELAKHGVNLEFDDFDMNQLFDDPGKSRTVVGRMKAKYMKGVKKDEP